MVVTKKVKTTETMPIILTGRLFKPASSGAAQARV